MLYRFPICFFMLESFVFAQMPPHYTVHDLGPLGPTGQVAAINIMGQVVGTNTLGGQTHGFRTGPNAHIDINTDDLGTLGGTTSQAFGINALGQVVGSSLTGTGETHGFRTAPNKRIHAESDDIGSLGGSSTIATAINNTGQVTGTSSTFGNASSQAFRTGPNRVINPMTDNVGVMPFSCAGAPPQLQGCSGVQVLRPGSSTGISINSVGDVAGYFTAPTTAYRTAFAHIGATNSALPFVLAPFNEFTGINDQGQIVGIAVNNFRDLSVWQAGQLSVLVPNCMCYPSRPNGINNSLQAVGFAQGPGSPHPFLEVDGKTYDLNALLPPGNGWTLQTLALNDIGQIAGAGTINGERHAFRLDPVLTPQQILTHITSALNGSALSKGQLRALTVNTQAALQELQEGDSHRARNQLNAFENKVNAQRGKALSEAQADLLISLAETAIQAL